MRETQYTVAAWAEETFGERDILYRAKMVLEEAVELCIDSGVWTGLSRRQKQRLLE